MISVDPSIVACGWAQWSEGVLVDCGLIQPTKSDSVLDRVRAVEHYIDDNFGRALIVMEYPQVYRYSARGNTDPNDLLPMAAIAGALCIGHQVHLVLPREWKGQMSKQVCGERVMSRLSAEEHLTIKAGTGRVASSLLHNVLDAIGIGLYYLKRLDRKRVIAR